MWTVDEVEYQKRRSQKITGYVCDSFVILYPGKVDAGSWGVGYGNRQLKACSHSWLWAAFWIQEYMNKSLSNQWFSMKIFWLLILAILFTTYVKSINSEWCIFSSGRYLPGVIEDKRLFLNKADGACTDALEKLYLKYVIFLIFHSLYHYFFLNKLAIGLILFIFSQHSFLYNVTEIIKTH